MIRIYLNENNTKSFWIEQDFRTPFDAKVEVTKLAISEGVIEAIKREFIPPPPPPPMNQVQGGPGNPYQHQQQRQQPQYSNNQVQPQGVSNVQYQQQKRALQSQTRSKQPLKKQEKNVPVPSSSTAGVKAKTPAVGVVASPGVVGGNVVVQGNGEIVTSNSLEKEVAVIPRSEVISDGAKLKEVIVVKEVSSSATIPVVKNLVASVLPVSVKGSVTTAIAGGNGVVRRVRGSSIAALEGSVLFFHSFFHLSYQKETFLSFVGEEVLFL